MTVLESILRTLTLYAVAECQTGVASQIDITSAGRTFRVADDGRGHSPTRTVGPAIRYIEAIYGQLNYPFSSHEPVPVQLQGLGIALINAFCEELRITARTVSGGASLTYRNGRLESTDYDADADDTTGTEVAGEVRPDLHLAPLDEERFDQWLRHVAQANPAAIIRHNDKRVPSR